MGTTAVYDLPYPDGSSLVIEGDDAMQALAEATEATIAGVVQDTQAALAWDGGLTILPGESAGSVGAFVNVDFPGTVAGLGAFSRTGDYFTYTGVSGRAFLVQVSVEVETGGGPHAGVNSQVDVLQASVTLASSYDEVSMSAATINTRSVVHTLTVPVVLTNGQTISVNAAASPAAALGVTSIRIYPMGPTP